MAGPAIHRVPIAPGEPSDDTRRSVSRLADSDRDSIPAGNRRYFGLTRFTIFAIGTFSATVAPSLVR
jgi:hypothetical protein